MSGIYLVKHWLKDPSDLQRETFSAVPFLANPIASERNIRYHQRDLNRCFTRDILLATDSQNELYEETRAKEINQTFGPRGSSNAFDLMIDLHNTTSNMGVCLILSSWKNYLEMHICHYIQTHLTDFTPQIYLYTEPGEELYDVASVAKHGICFEIGPQSPGVVRADKMQVMRVIVQLTLDFINRINQGVEFPAFETDVFQHIGNIDFPRSFNGEISAVIHPSLQDQDFSPLHPGDPAFLSLDKKTIPYDGQHAIYPIFINEAAYYEKKIAFIASQKIHVSVPAIQSCRKQENQ
ncbi:hypothetical protein GDO86_012995 [Hymenochirus boettgeri]|uniref:N-acyl-aromatic-L-amino acid amidohydrolase n=1 Tax=Hymenochirus boettgeri TaxID=247094 RepID=A0A8T2IWR7_9PIPI|nr:hypothetical protein GDO86_012995 [Hymenochirus boettgeri]